MTVFILLDLAGVSARQNCNFQCFWKLSIYAPKNKQAVKVPGKKKERKKEYSFIYMLFLQIGAHSPLQSKGAIHNQDKFCECMCAHAHTCGQTHAHTHTHNLKNPSISMCSILHLVDELYWGVWGHEDCAEAAQTGLNVGQAGVGQPPEEHRHRPHAHKLLDVFLRAPGKAAQHDGRLGAQLLRNRLINQPLQQSGKGYSLHHVMNFYTHTHTHIHTHTHTHTQRNKRVC